jgi:predicted ATP-grasp superfamily ATP-dependent carboligase
MKPRIAAFLNDIGPAVLSRADQKNLYGIVLKGSELERYARANLSCPLVPITRNTLAPQSSDENVLDDAILYTNLLTQLRKHSIDTVLVPAQQSSRRIVSWARDNHIALLQVPHALGRTLEDKIKFDALMRQHKVRVPPLVNTKKSGSKKNELVVLQKRSGCGGSGTTIVRRRDLSGKLATDSVLIRKYIDGIPLGISIVVDGDGNYFCSALRRQCLAMTEKNSPRLMGLQWMSKTWFSKKSLRIIKKMNDGLIRFFLDIHFVGVANIDFILARDAAYVIECNPRFSGATPQVFSKKQATPHPHPWRFLLNAFLDKKNAPFHDSSIPPSTYEGSLTYIDAEKKMTAAGDIPVGQHMIHNDELRPCQEKTPGSFFLLHELPCGFSTVKEGETLCYILSDEQLFSEGGVPTESTALLRSTCYKVFSAADTLPV